MIALVCGEAYGAEATIFAMPGPYKGWFSRRTTPSGAIDGLPRAV
ncbi:hypothetical protein RM812_40490 [Streptomyces sp. DSM 40712]|uniref:Uncharacterized protein n=1 Tax=Streptomyces lancefieldiae TaxID=3075520 RepID=A0ABU3B1P6_9ACTN|nr:hypothetical protein [Streptomyces sp. DSM 40712]MDT0616373.1 hypothetical protein [Streptomyces sp. DSM 40712]